MIGVLFPYTAVRSGRILLAAIRRSCSETMVYPVTLADIDAWDTLAVVDAPDEWAASLIEWMKGSGRKMLMFGKPPVGLAEFLEWRWGSWPEAFEAMAKSAPATPGRSCASALSVVYAGRAGLLGGRAWRRPFERFDFSNEWNNLGYGRIEVTNSHWSVSTAVDTGVHEVACIEADGQSYGSYSALADFSDSALLWFNRSVGPCDSFEWRLVENFISSYRCEELSCKPVLLEVPLGYDAVVTSRLDCDEDVESSRPLFQLYLEKEVPFTLAVHTSNLAERRHHRILREVLDNGGAVLSHTATHAPRWGGSYEAALKEARASAAALKDVTGCSPRYAVAPFHHAPHYALQALSDAGYSGCIGGVINCDPQFLMARGGRPAGLPEAFVGHSQQCMLHGDCLQVSGDPIEIYKSAFRIAEETKTLFGYLDHPFSERYAYGWSGEGQRLEIHERFLDYMTADGRAVLFMDEESAMDFIQYKSKVIILGQGGEYKIHLPFQEVKYSLAVEYKGECRAACDGGVVQ